MVKLATITTPSASVTPARSQYLSTTVIRLLLHINVFSLFCTAEICRQCYRIRREGRLPRKHPTDGYGDDSVRRVWNG